MAGGNIAERSCRLLRFVLRGLLFRRARSGCGRLRFILCYKRRQRVCKWDIGSIAVCNRCLRDRQLRVAAGLDLEREHGKCAVFGHSRGARCCEKCGTAVAGAMRIAHSHHALDQHSIFDLGAFEYRVIVV